MAGPQARTVVARWLSLVAADAELSAYLIGVDWDRLKAHLARTLITGTGGGAAGPEVPSLGWSEVHHRRAVGYLTWVLAAADQVAGQPVADQPGTGT